MQPRAVLAHFQVRAQRFAQRRRVFEGKCFRIRLEEEIEGIDDGHVRHQAHLHLELALGLREHDAGHEVPEGILLPIEEMPRGMDLEGIGLHRRAAMRRRPEPYKMRRKGNRAVVSVRRDML